MGKNLFFVQLIFEKLCIMTSFLASTNLITDLKFKQKVGVKADAHVEALAVINQDNIEEQNLRIVPEDREELQINAKLFLKSFKPDLALEALEILKEALGVDKIDSLTLTVPAEGIDWIGIGAHSVNEDVNETSAKNEDPKRQSICKKMKLLWKELTEKLENDVTTLGLCDLETDVFFNLFNEATIKPANFQVNLKSCCVVPPDLQNFSKEHKIKLNTHADPPTVLTPDFMQNIQGDLNPQWIIRYQLFIKSRGVLQDKRYLIQNMK